MTGEHNRRNALAALAAARDAGVPLDRGIDALCRFSGVRRRMEIRGVAGGVTVYDDFAHHPTAIRTTIDGLRAQVGDARILAALIADIVGQARAGDHVLIMSNGGFGGVHARVLKSLGEGRGPSNAGEP